MRAKRPRLRRRQPNEQKQKPFFDKQGPDGAAPFFTAQNGIQTKLAIGKANDPMEKEADAAARQVMGQQQVQRAEKKEEEKPVQKAEQKEEEKPVQKAEQKEEEKPVQKAEQKEEEKPVQKAEQKEEEKPVQKADKEEEKPQAKLELQRKGDDKEEEPVQAKLENDVQAAPDKDQKQEGTEAARPNLETLLKQRKGRGNLLPDDLRIELEKKFKSDFKQVRIHTDTEAMAMCNAIHAQAFTHGYDIYFNEDKYNPNSPGGKELLAHELAHVVQQKG